ncbi:hypothetical protein C1H46_010474 [Malus baccata]|uniref:Uncharacterized protein n=1 Tax=Malus baccata TaxID=106549 RepID=A0A540MYS7_MALBA|nr:hypothetical protein C1H46_010474 [Malus baccata]
MGCSTMQLLHSHLSNTFTFGCAYAHQIRGNQAPFQILYLWLLLSGPLTNSTHVDILFTGHVKRSLEDDVIETKI